mgnify:CR=1 FL=1
MNKVYDLIFNEENPSWESIIYKLVREDKIDPWDIDVSVLTKEYLKMMDNLEIFNFRISGKVILAAAILLKLKSRELGLTDFIDMTEDNPPEEVYAIDFPEVLPTDETNVLPEKKEKKVNVKVPRARQRKVTLSELTEALRKAIEVEERREQRKKHDINRMEKKRNKIKTRRKGIDIFKKIKEVYNRVRIFVKDKKGDNADFLDILPSNKKEDVIWTFVPLLYLSNSGKIKIDQKESFGPIWVSLNKKVNGKRKKQN